MIKGYAADYIDEIMRFPREIIEAINQVRAGTNVKGVIRLKVPALPASLQQELERLSEHPERL